MITLTQFGYTSPQLYTFPPLSQIDYQDNFAELVTRTGRLPGAHGGFDELQTSASLHEVGTLATEFWLHYNSVSEATSKLEAFRQMGDWGKQLLYMQPDDLSQAKRWCWARVNDIQSPQNVRDLPHKRQRVKIVFQVSDPFWYGKGNQNLWDSTYNWDSSINWDGTGLTTITGSGSLTVTPSGNAFTHARFVAKVTGAQAFHQLLVQRMVNGGVADQVLYQGALVQNDVIEIDPRRQWILVNGNDGIASFDFKFPDWLRLYPGANTIQVTLDEPTAAIDATVRYYERFT